jgi:ATP-dependent helicase HrpA
MPVQERARAAAVALEESGCKDYMDRLVRWLSDRFDLQVSKMDWDIQALPEHIRPRVRVVNHKGKKVYEGKRLQRVEKAVQTHRKEVHLETWEDACRKWEKHDVSTWSFGDLPERVLVGKQGEHPLYAYPGLLIRDGVLSVRLFPSMADARVATKSGWVSICVRQFERELAWWQKDLATGKALTLARTYYVSMGSIEEFSADAYSNLISYLFECSEQLPLKQTQFDKTIQQARARIMGLWQEAVDLFNKILELKHQLEMDSKSYSGMSADLASLFPARWLLHVPFSQLKFYPKYLKAMQIRSERARSNAIKDREKSARLQPWVTQLNESYRGLAAGDPRWIKWTQLRWMLEDYKVSLFAQELGTPRPVSEKRMSKLLEEIRGIR